jgi:hypothetical protein
MMQIGVHLPHIGRKATPEVIARAAVQAEELGIADVWVSEHVILPKDAPYPPSPAFLEPILTPCLGGRGDQARPARHQRNRAADASSGADRQAARHIADTQ